MATNPISPNPLPHDEAPLSNEEWWAMLDSLAGSMEGWFPDEGGASGVLRKERELWGE